MSDFSASPLDFLLANQQKGYNGLHIEQGVPVLDRDLNLLHDLVTAGIRQLFTRYVGSGLATGTDGFGIQALPAGQNTQDFQITAPATGPGSILVGGLEVTIAAAVDYASQTGVAPLTTPQPTQPDPRPDTVYLDVFLVEVDGTTDPDLNNSQDVGMETSVRLKPAWLVQVAEGVPVPPPPDGHAFCPLAGLSRPRGVATIDQTMLTDLRQRRLTVSDLEQRLSLLERVLLLPAFVAPPLPQFIPKSGVTGEAITLNGSNFNVGAPQVLFGDTAAAIVGTPSAGQLVAQVPAGLTPGGAQAVLNITVSNAGGSAVSDEVFVVVPAPAFAPPGSQFTPASGTPGTQVTLSGYNFTVSAPQVLFGTQAATVVGTPTSTSLVVQVPAGVVPAGSTQADVKITVTTSQGSAVSDDEFHAQVDIPAPAFVAAPLPQFTPKTGFTGQTITLNGTNFNFPPVTVQFGSIPAALVGGPSPTQIAVIVPPSGTPQTLPITVTTAGGSVTSTDVFVMDPLLP
ncbi:MAG: IPT/TIG domain-containing protein [Streptosporangiaceae bacterium]|jgi:hypothetical protein